MVSEVSDVQGEQAPAAEIVFEQGIPGFENVHRFELVHLDDGLPFKLLQAVGQEEISFVVANPFVFYPEYEWDMPSALQQELGIEDQSEVEIWSVVTMSDSLENATVNLLAPIVVNTVKKLGRQHILHDSPYQTRHPLVREADGGSGE